MDSAPRTIWTIGHSTHPLDVLVGLLRAQRIECVADVRRFPGSRRHPQFGSEALAAGLPDAGIGYRHFGALGGRRTPQPDSRNGVWRNAAFRGYADYMASADYRAAFAALQALAREQRCALLCAEVLWWRCHRSLIADDLVLHGWRVVHILGNGHLTPHAFREPARLLDGVPVYGSGQAPLF
ncbi:MAG: DUF488 domain-containing protein [Rhodanobacteraceae bacterium]|jgi:uncharacterized protein (DUF488 family)|nr:DUF488 domain-containing protein [Rhodanobacteraceae bacterium]